MSYIQTLNNKSGRLFHHLIITALYSGGNLATSTNGVRRLWSLATRLQSCSNLISSSPSSCFTFYLCGTFLYPWCFDSCWFPTALLCQNICSAVYFVYVLQKRFQNLLCHYSDGSTKRTACSACCCPRRACPAPARFSASGALSPRTLGATRAGPWAQWESAPETQEWWSRSIWVHICIRLYRLEIL